MLIDKITSRQNPFIKRFYAVRQGHEHHLILIEGVRLMEEAIRAKLHFEAVAYTERLRTTERGAALYYELLKLPCRGAEITEALMKLIGDVETSQGVVAITHLPYATFSDAIQYPTPLMVIAHQLQDPGNLGTIMRTAEAAGADSMMITPSTVNPFNLKVLRAAMGAAFRLPIITGVKIHQLAEFCQTNNITLVAASSHAKQPYTEYDWTKPTALLLGQEGNGIDPVAVAYVNQQVTIPMSPIVESLNVAIAAAILLYEAARQRQFSFNSPK